MTLLHEFHLLPDAGDRARQRRELFDPKFFTRAGRERPKRGRVLSEELFEYLEDTLAWIPTEHFFGTRERGFDRYGQTGVSGEGARVLALLLHAWASVFKNGPEVLELTGGWEYQGGEAGPGRHAKLFLPRDPAIASLKEVAALAEKATSPGLWLLHIGL